MKNTFSTLYKLLLSVPLTSIPAYAMEEGYDSLSTRPGTSIQKNLGENGKEEILNAFYRDITPYLFDLKTRIEHADKEIDHIKPHQADMVSTSPIFYEYDSILYSLLNPSFRATAENVYHHINRMKDEKLINYNNHTKLRLPGILCFKHVEEAFVKDKEFENTFGGKAFHEIGFREALLFANERQLEITPIGSSRSRQYTRYTLTEREKLTYKTELEVIAIIGSYCSAYEAITEEQRIIEQEAERNGKIQYLQNTIRTLQIPQSIGCATPYLERQLFHTLKKKRQNALLAQRAFDEKAVAERLVREYKVVMQDQLNELLKNKSK